MTEDELRRALEGIAAAADRNIRDQTWERFIGGNIPRADTTYPRTPGLAPEDLYRAEAEASRRYGKGFAFTDAPQETETERFHRQMRDLYASHGVHYDRYSFDPRYYSDLLGGVTSSYARPSPPPKPKPEPPSLTLPYTYNARRARVKGTPQRPVLALVADGGFMEGTPKAELETWLREETLKCRTQHGVWIIGILRQTPPNERLIAGAVYRGGGHWKEAEIKAQRFPEHPYERELFFKLEKL